LLISVITVCANNIAGLRETERSIRGQADTSLEWIVVDGSSRDGTVEYLKNLNLPYLAWVSEEDDGTYDAMNKGTARARGQYVTYLNSGDVFSTAGALASVRRCLDASSWPDVLYGGANWLFANGARLYRPPRAMSDSIRHGLPGMHQATYYRREFLDTPPYDLRFSVSSDYYLSARSFIKGARACCLRDPLVDFAVGGASMARARRSRHECWAIQRDVLRLGVLARTASILRRFAAQQCLAVLHKLNAPQRKWTI
jgi:putative colanic acid biosynthesis glycosyltransferase